jgi:exo-beta-1,3-glucanase (GH17 family)/glycosyltransferase involved in cell wall biosynthesis
MRNKTLLIATMALLANALLWLGFNRPHEEIPWTGKIGGVSFSPYRANQDPFENAFPSAEEIDHDLAFLSDKVTKVRTYSSLDGMEQVPALAAKHGLKVTAGAWLDTRLDRNDAEIANLIHNAKKFSNIERVIVGNESILRGDFTVAELGAYLRKVRNATNIPVSTAEPWHVWIKHPELAQYVDFITIHILPYWEGIPADGAINFLVERYDQVKRAFPGKRIVIGETGWPSGGDRRMWSRPSLVNEASFLRQFLNLAKERKFDYFVMEAFDQPWKTKIEEEVGAHWGIYNVDRKPKFAMTGPVVENPWWSTQALIAVSLALFPMVWFLRKWPQLATSGRVFYAMLMQVAASMVAWIAFVPVTLGLGLAGQIAWGVLLPAQLALLAVMLINGFEFAEIGLGGKLKRRFPALRLMRGDTPKVSLHLAICKEPPEVVIQTLNSLAALDYPNFEVLVVDNNTPDESLWKPVQEHCATLGSRFRFFSLGKWPGYKAGALNFALRETAADAQIVGVIDSDYVVRPDWLRATVPYFSSESVGFVQAPQDNREWEHSTFGELLNWEYAGFFHIGMVHRNERDAIIQHGTMTLIRRAALDNLGGWSEWCICEDSELGLRLMKDGYSSVYVNEVFGRGLTPHTFAGYKGQRFRWVYGAVQILKRHWRSLLPWSKDGSLTSGQRYHFVSGWLPWFADAMHLVFTLAAVFWTLGLLALPQYFDFPLAAFLVPAVVMFAFKIYHSLHLYRTRVPCTTRQRWLAAVGGMSITHAIARGIFAGLFTNNAPFLRTPKAEDKPAVLRGLAMAREEAYLMIGLWTAAAALAISYGTANEDALLWQTVLLVQSLPYVAAIYTAMVSVLPNLRRAPASAAPVPVPATLAVSSPDTTPRRAA